MKFHGKINKKNKSQKLLPMVYEYHYHAFHIASYSNPIKIWPFFHFYG